MDEYLDRTIRLGVKISEWTRDKALFFRKKIVSPILPCVVIADILVESNWGKHPLAQPFYNKRYSNNLAGLEADQSWDGRTNRYEDGKLYRAYQDQTHFATNYSDMLIFNKAYLPILSTTDYKLQIRELAKFKKDSIKYAVQLESLIQFYELDKIKE